MAAEFCGSGISIMPMHHVCCILGVFPLWLAVPPTMLGMLVFDGRRFAVTAWLRCNIVQNGCQARGAAVVVVGVLSTWVLCGGTVLITQYVG
jgi:hypothetical protein